MTKEQSIRCVRDFALHHAKGDLPHSYLTVEALELAVKALEIAPDEWFEEKYNYEIF